MSTKFVFGFPGLNRSEIKFAEITIEKPHKMMLHMAELDFEQLRNLILNIELGQRPTVSEYYKESDHFLVQGEVVCPKLEFCRKKFTPSGGSTLPISDRIWLLEKVFMTIPSLRRFSLVKIRKITTPIVLEMMPMYKISKSAYDYFLDQEEYGPWDARFGQFSNIPSASHVKVPEAWNLKKFMRKLDKRLAAPLIGNEPAFPTSTEKRVEEIDSHLAAFESTWTGQK